MTAEPTGQKSIKLRLRLKQLKLCNVVYLEKLQINKIWLSSITIEG